MQHAMYLKMHKVTPCMASKQTQRMTMRFESLVSTSQHEDVHTHKPQVGAHLASCEACHTTGAGEVPRGGGGFKGCKAYRAAADTS